MLQQVLTAGGAFTATNLDDIVILVLFFSRLDQRLRPIHVVSGQVLGFSLLVLISLVGFLGQSLLPATWLGLLGLLPISLGVSRLIEGLASQGADPGGEPQLPLTRLPLAALGLPPSWAVAEVLGIASLTVANGSDNISVYMPLFAHASPTELGITLLTFAAGVGLWCLVAWRLTRSPWLASVLSRCGDRCIPVVLITLGTLIVIDSHTLEQPWLALITYSCLAVMAASLLQPLRIHAGLPAALSAGWSARLASGFGIAGVRHDA